MLKAAPSRTTLVSEVHLTRPDGATRMHDVGVRVDTTTRNRTVVRIGFARSYPVVVTLSEGERIALIEALGGHA